MALGKWRERMWKLTPRGREALADMAENAKIVAEVHQATLLEQQRYPEIARQARVLEEAARRNGFVNQLSNGFKPRTT